jgi:hypothetical protein
MGVVSFPVRLKKGSLVTGFTYRNGKEAETPKPPCNGTINEPIAEPGNLCVYRGQQFGSLEEQDKNAAFFGAQAFSGEPFTTSKKVGVLGELIVFRSLDFTEEGTTPATLKEATIMEAGGSWAVQEK